VIRLGWAAARVRAGGLPAAEEVAPDRLVQPVCRTVAGSPPPRRPTDRPVAGALTVSRQAGRATGLRPPGLAWQ